MPEQPRLEDAVHLPFLVTGLVVSLSAGLVLGGLEPVFGPRVIAAHAELQAFGFLGLIIAGMSLRLFPRLCRRPPPPVTLTLGLFLLLTGGSLGTAFDLPAASLLLAAGLLATAALLAWTVLPPPRPLPSWWPAAALAAAWWGATGALVAAGSLDGAARCLVLGVGVTTVAGVQGRMVPVFFGRSLPSHGRLLAPLALYTAGLAAGFLWPLADVAAGAGLAWLVAVTGALGGRAHRLTPNTAAAGPAIILANLAAVLAALLLAAAGLLGGGFADAALHLLALGTLASLIVTMGRLLIPVFAIERAAGPAGRWLLAPPYLLAAAGLLRAAEALAPATGGILLPVAGALAWIGLAIFTVALTRATALYAGRRRSLQAAARPPRDGP